MGLMGNPKKDLHSADPRQEAIKTSNIINKTRYFIFDTMISTTTI